MSIVTYILVVKDNGYYVIDEIKAGRSFSEAKHFDEVSDILDWLKQRDCWDRSEVEINTVYSDVMPLESR